MSRLGVRSITSLCFDDNTDLLAGKAEELIGLTHRLVMP